LDAAEELLEALDLDLAFDGSLNGFLAAGLHLDDVPLAAGRRVGFGRFFGGEFGFGFRVRGRLLRALLFGRGRCRRFRIGGGGRFGGFRVGWRGGFPLGGGVAV